VGARDQLSQNRQFVISLVRNTTKQKDTNTQTSDWINHVGPVAAGKDAMRPSSLKAAPCVLQAWECGVGLEHAIGELGLAPGCADVFPHAFSSGQAGGREGNRVRLSGEEIEIAGVCHAALVEEDQARARRVQQPD